MNSKSKKTKIVIAGGGFAGLYAAKYLNKRLARRRFLNRFALTEEIGALDGGLFVDESAETRRV